MKIEINPRSLLNLEHICEVLYKLHPSVLEDLIIMQRTLGNVLGFIDTDNLSLEEREYIANNYVKKDYSKENQEKDYSKENQEKDLPSKSYEELIEGKDLTSLTH